MVGSVNKELDDTLDPLIIDPDILIVRFIPIPSMYIYKTTVSSG